MGELAIHEGDTLCLLKSNLVINTQQRVLRRGTQSKSRLKFDLIK